MKLRIISPILFSLGVVFSSEASAIINYGHGNEGNTTDPGNGVPWANVSRLTNSLGTKIGSSAVYLGNGYMLTANHVGNDTHVTFDGSTLWEVLPGSYQQVASNLDLKVFQLAADPGLPTLMLYEDSVESEDLSRASVLVGWGLGRDPAISPNTNDVDWGGTGTIAKRWGENMTLPTPSSLTYSYNSEPYDYSALSTHLSSESGPNEAAATLYDSGSALFQNIGGNWYLSGIAAVVTENGFSEFGPDSETGHFNYFVRLSSFSNEITAVIPEPSTWGLLVGCGALAGTAFFRRRKI